MPNKRLSMRKLREILRLRFETGLSVRQIGVVLRTSPTTVSEYLRRLEEAGIGWPLANDVTDEEIERRLFPSVTKAETRPVPDWALVQRELKRHKGVTLRLLWQEYTSEHADGYAYSRFCELYGEWLEGIDVTMRQDHRAGEKLFVDYAGVTVPIHSRTGGEAREAQIFVAVLGASNYTYAEPTLTQTLRDWIEAHVRAFAYFGGTPELLVPDNAKTGVKSPCFYDPDLNPTYQDLAAHYGIAVLPTRVRRPKDKAKVEKGVQEVERQILAPLRNMQFFSLADLSREIRRLLEVHNHRPFQKLPGSRRSLFEELERPALRPLPAQAYEFAEWRRHMLARDYHLEIDGHYYSAPYQLRRRKLDVRLTGTIVEIFCKGRREASHRRSFVRGGRTTVAAHMPKHHRDWANRTPERYRKAASKIGPAAASLIEELLTRGPHPQLAFKSCEGILRLVREYGRERVEAACVRALALGTVRYRSVRSMLERGLEGHPLPEEIPSGDSLPTAHVNIRGADYYRNL